MAYEIDFLPVGNGQKNGDAIAIRYGEPGAYKILVYDGGTQASGKALVEHIRQHYETDYVDDVVNSHPDLDHASGLSVVLEELRVGNLWMHRPWEHSHLILEYFRDGRITDNSLKERLQNKLGASYALEKIAIRKNIPIQEPFQGAVIGEFHVLSPSRDWYVHDLIPDFEKSPEKRTIQTTRLGATTGLLTFAMEAAKQAIAWVAERWDQEYLRENIETSAENESSVILYGYMNNEDGLLLTGDAGILALRKAVDHLRAHQIDPVSILKFIQIPHHGSRHNVSTSILDMLLGPRLPSPPMYPTKVAYVSAGPESEYPRKMVSNAFIRRGCSVIATKGTAKQYQRGTPDRQGWSATEKIAFSDKVEPWS